ncbi:DMT family transporter [Massilia sp. R2A-15]|uniref:DMT family transporter n=1 Tax=Massilia sp. R2A-15 TaxID=3064278 RepID=UPI0027339A57|nr:DMT family transporter [Massilia sp. R2A-15]WLI88691.1 DMT family transporter [Massilia sp. R2A-15]
MRTALLTFLALLAFAGNSVLCRIALKQAHIDPASFIAIRLVSGAVVLALIVMLRGARPTAAGNWISAAALFAYAAFFSFAYVGLTTATGALLLFGSVQATMIAFGLWRGDRLGPWQMLGMLCAMAGLVDLLLPGLEAPSPARAALMIAAGAAWGVYSLRAKGAGDPTRATAGNFVRAAVLAALLYLPFLSSAHVDSAGVMLALASGAVTSGLGYAIWYAALQGLRPATAATVQLSVPAIAALGGVLLLAEPLTWQLAGAFAAIVGGMAVVILTRPR